MNWQLLIQALGMVTGAMVAAYQIRQLLPSSKSQLKADLEILKLLDPADEAYPILQDHIRRAIQIGRASCRERV